MPVIHIQKPMPMKKVLGATPHEEQALMNILFLGTGVNETYQLFTLTGLPIQTSPPVVAKDVDFTFSLLAMPGIVWTVTNFVINEDQATGNWSNPLRRKEQDDGSFQATAGPVIVEDAVASATA